MTMLSMMQAVQQITTDAGLGFHDAVAGVAALALTGFWREMHSLKREITSWRATIDTTLFGPHGENGLYGTVRDHEQRLRRVEDVVPRD